MIIYVAKGFVKLRYTLLYINVDIFHIIIFV